MTPVFEVIFNSFFGVHFINHRTDHGTTSTYLDVDLDIQRTSDKIFLTIHDDNIYVSVGGLSFVDVVYSGEFRAEQGEAFNLVFDDNYIEPTTMINSYDYEVLTRVIPDTLHQQLVVVKDSQRSEED